MTAAARATASRAADGGTCCYWSCCASTVGSGAISTITDAVADTAAVTVCHYCC